MKKVAQEKEKNLLTLKEAKKSMKIETERLAKYCDDEGGLFWNEAQSSCTKCEEGLDWVPGKKKCLDIEKEQIRLKQKLKILYRLR